MGVRRLPNINDVEEAFEDWYGTLTRYHTGFPAKGTIGGGLVVLDRLREECSLDIREHTATGGSQISGVSGPAVQDILERFGETRVFLSEGGRTNRGLRGDMSSMLQALSEAGWDEMAFEEREDCLARLQEFLVERVRDYHNRQRLSIDFDSRNPLPHTVRKILDVAEEGGKAGAVAQYIVGAKLQLRFPDLEIGNESYSTADSQLNRPGDFHVGTTAFHVTMAPQPGVYDRCVQNIRDGLTPCLLVPERILVGAQQNAEGLAPGMILVASIESFVGQNVEELAEFGEERRMRRFAELLNVYNERVDAAETDKSIMMDIPAQLEAYVSSSN
jgi:hypothetical protein